MRTDNSKSPVRDYTVLKTEIYPMSSTDQNSSYLQNQKRKSLFKLENSKKDTSNSSFLGGTSS